MEEKKEYFDKRLISYIEQNKQEKEEKNFIQKDIQEGFIFIDGEKLIVETRKIWNDAISIIMPKFFYLMDDDIAKIKYPYETRPVEIYTNKDADINFTFNLEEYVMSVNEVKKVRDAFSELIEKENSTSIMLTKETIHARIGEVACVEFITKAIDMDIYCNLFITEFYNHPFIGSFNCPEYDKISWEDYVKQMIKSLTLIE